MRFQRFSAFTSIAIAAALLAGCGGGGQSESVPGTGGNLAVIPPGSSAQLIYVADFENNSILEYAIDANGNAAPVATITGANTQLDSPLDVAVDTSGNIYTVSTHCKCVLVFAAGASGNVAPIRKITRAPNDFGDPRRIGIDGSNNLYVEDEEVKSIDVFAPGANGRIAAIRTIAGSNTGLLFPFGMTVDVSGKVYVANLAGEVNGCAVTGSVTVYAAGANGNVTPIQTITGPDAILHPIAVAVDAAGNIFASNGDEIAEFAAGANGDAVPINTISGSQTTLASAGGNASLAVDASENIYYATFEAAAIDAFSAGSSGNVAPTRVITGSSTGLTAPYGVRVR
jgi:hypothetical protein